MLVVCLDPFGLYCLITRQSPALRAGNELGFKVFKLRKGGKRMQVAGVGGGDVALDFG